jgi:KUP system potassium uptake protein
MVKAVSFQFLHNPSFLTIFIPVAALTISLFPGTFALYSLLARFSNIVKRDPNVVGSIKMERHLTNDLKPMNQGVRNFIENSAIARVVLKILGVLGVAMVMADGVLTPGKDF